MSHRPSDMMSSIRPAQPNTGLILQGDRIMGGVNLPEASEAFIREFNTRYGHLGIRVVPNYLLPNGSPTSETRQG